jgi:TRAP-type transport system periplasmic protein
MNRQLSRRALLATLGAVGIPIGAPSSSAAAVGDSYTLRLGFADTTTSAQGLAALRFASAVNRRTNGRLKVEVYPGGQLGQQQETVDGLTTGVVDLALTSATLLQPLVPKFQVLDMPFLFKDLAAGLRVLDGPIGAEFFAELETKGILGLGWGISGLRELETTNKPVVTPEDAKGLRVRIQSGAVNVATYQALGAIPVAIDVNEAFTALSQHTVDGIDLPLSSFTVQKFYVSCKHIAMSNHTLVLIPVLGSKRKIDALPRALQTVLKEEGRAVIPFWRANLAQQTAAQATFLKQNGVAFTEIQYPAFRKAMEPVYAQFQAKLGGDLIDRITRAANAA